MALLSLERLYLCKAEPAATTSKKYFEDYDVRWFWDSFQDQFFGLEIHACNITELAVWKLEQNLLDTHLIAELEDKIETSVSQLRQFLNDNRRSSEHFVFYLRGKDGNLWAVDVYWDSKYDCWHVGAYSVSHQKGWGAGRQLVSRY